MLYKRPTDKLDAEPIIGTERGSTPVFSPDGSAVAFAARGKLMRIDLRDGALPEELASLSGQGGSVGLSWFSNGDILFADFGRGLSRTHPNGKKPIEVTTVDSAKGERHSFPVVLDDETILFTIFPTSKVADAQIVAKSLLDGHTKTLITGGADARFIPPGYLVYMKSDTLMAATFNPKTWKTGQGVPVLEDVRVSLTGQTPGQETSAGQFAVSAAGHLVYVGGGERPDPVSTMVWVDRHGTARPIEAPVRLYTSPRLSHDGTRVVYNTQRGPARDIWIHNFSAPQSPSRMTFRDQNTSPIWSPDDARLAFSSTENSLRDIFGKLVDGKTGPKPLADPPTVAGAARDPISWKNGYILFTERHTDNTRSIMLLAEGQTQPTVWMEPQGDYAFRFPEFSPDGRYVAYGSNESGKWEVYVRPFQGDGPRVQVSEGGGIEPVWASSSTLELFYRRSRGKVMAAEISTTPVLKVRRRTVLFDDIYEVVAGHPSRNYDVTADGTQFLMVKANPEAPEPPAAYIIKVTNWIEELKKRLSVTVK